MHAEVIITGVVQGVGFRPFIYRIASEHGLVGYVQNRGDAGVKVEVEGPEEELRRFVEDIERKKPPLAQIYSLTVSYSDNMKGFTKFEIVESSKVVERPGSVIPADVAICDDCIAELKSPSDRRYRYFFITCTNCGPRFTTIEDVPYDRPTTTLVDFPMCKRCSAEYHDPSNRRFHAQTIACWDCGPRVYLTTSDGEEISCQDPIAEASKLIEEGFIVAIKGNGGFHIATSTLKTEPIMRLRRVKHRRQKPFAIMARSLDSVKTFAKVSSEEEKLLISHIRPIVLLEKKDDYYLSDLISPKLHNVGVMLPYTALHLLLFDQTKEPAFVMTSANPPSQPIVKDNEEALRRMGKDIDYFLFHNRRIAHRCDDSVVKFVSGKPSIIRRSRGYAPEPIQLKSPAKRCVLALGGELNVTSCIVLGKKAYISQHVGDVEELETFLFLKEATDHLVHLVKGKVEAVACDLHPKFKTTRLALEMEKKGIQAFKVQHHHAHIASLMGEYGIDEMVGVSCDGVGYGEDGSIWGGEVLYCSLGEYKRVGHLQPQPMAGGDLATRYPIRMVAGMLRDRDEAESWLLAQSHHLPHGKKEAELILNQLSRRKSISTTSCGRVLDAVAAILGVCYERTYEGEPAMKLESLALKGKDALRLQPQLEGSVLNTSILIEEILHNLGKYTKADLAYTAHSYLAEGLGEIAIEKARSLGVDKIGFSGGVAYNEVITRILRSMVEAAGMKFFTNVQVPSGDGGLSFGQAVVALYLLNSK